MKRLVAVFLIITQSIAILCLNGCGNKQENVVNVYNWGEYIDESIFEQFEEQTGITVNYSTFSSCEMMYSSIKSGGSTYDVIVPSDYMVARMIKENMLIPLDYSKIPNFNNLDGNYLNLEFDPEQKYTVPYMWGTTGIIYNKLMVTDPPESWMDLFNTNLIGQVLIFDNPRDCIGIALKALGYSFNTTEEAEISEAIELLIRQKEKGIVQAYVMDQIFDKMINDEAAIGTYYAGDFLTMVEENPNLEFVMPKEGANLFVDAMCIPTCCQNYENALAFINFMCSDDIVLANCEETGYSTPSITAKELMDEEWSSNDVAYPSVEVLDKCEAYGGLPDQTLAFYDHEWIRLCLAKVKYN